MTGEARDTSARESFATTPTLGQTTPILHDRGYTVQCSQEFLNERMNSKSSRVDLAAIYSHIYS